MFLLLVSVIYDILYSLDQQFPHFLASEIASRDL